MNRTLSWTITEASAGLKIEEFLRNQKCSHHVLTHLKRTENGILLNNIWAYSSQRLTAGDQLTVRIIEPESSENIVPMPLPLSVIYEDEDLMVINKASDTPIHPSINNYDNTLANAVMYYFRQKGEAFVYRCINRLDRDTSGLLILAKNMLSGAILSQMSANRQIHREYLAVTEGLLPEAGTIDAPIARLEDSAIMRCVDFEKGEHAVTHFKRIKYVPADATTGYSLASVCLETGRTHQIRVHMKHIGHPLPGDFLYNPSGNAPIKRQALHSHRLQFRHPITDEPLEFTCDMPDDMQNIFRQ